MIPILLTAVLTAILTSMLTLWLGARLFQRRVQPQLEERLSKEWAEAEETLQQRVQDGALEALEESKLLEELQGIGDQVRQGALAAVAEAELEEKLAALEEEIERRVRKGVVDGITSMATAGPLRDTTVNVTEAGANLVGEGLGALLSGLARTIVPADETEDDE